MRTIYLLKAALGKICMNYMKEYRGGFDWSPVFKALKKYTDRNLDKFARIENKKVKSKN